MRVKVTLPVRFVALGEAVHSSTRELSEEGAFIRCVEPPPPGTRVMLRLELPGGGLDTVAEVEEVAIDPSDSGFWGRFSSPEPLLLDRVRLALGGERPTAEAVAGAAPGIGRNRRNTTRFLDRLTVKLGGRGKEPGVFALDVSSTGLFLLTPRPPEVDTVLQLALELPDQLPPCQVIATVVRTVTAEQAAAQRRSPGAGVVFVGGGDEFRHRFDAYLAMLGKK
jgi:hypothetical protein